jgi:hypothetical protein
MAKRPIGISAKWLKQLPVIAAIYAFYEYYAAGGVDGIKADLEALSFDGIKAKAKEIITAFAVFMIADAIATNIKDKYAKTGIRTIGYYVGAKQLAQILDAGSTISRQTAATKPSAGTSAASYTGRGY